MIRRTIPVVLTALLLFLGAPPTYAGDLNQVVTADEQRAPAGTSTDFRAGHGDIGPLVVDDAGVDVFVRDDSVVPPVWRDLSDVVFVVGDNARQALPDGDEFAFTGAQPNQEVWVVPQVEQVGVPWLGWSTQSPGFVAVVDRGITMTYVGHQGPGEFTLFVQNGGFEQPQVLWTSQEQRQQDLWVDVNTHTHANWVFTEPGVHQVAVRITAVLQVGGTVDVTKVLTFAVGDGVDVQAAHDTKWDAANAEAEAAATSVVDSNSGTDRVSGQSNEVWLWVLIGVVAVFMILSVVVIVRSLRPRRRQAQHQQAPTQQPQQPPAEGNPRND